MCSRSDDEHLGALGRVGKKNGVYPVTRKILKIARRIGR